MQNLIDIRDSVHNNKHLTGSQGLQMLNRMTTSLDKLKDYIYTNFASAQLMDFSESDKHEAYENMENDDLILEFERNSNKIWRELSTFLIFKTLKHDNAKDRLIRKQQVLIAFTSAMNLKMKQKENMNNNQQRQDSMKIELKNAMQNKKDRNVGMPGDGNEEETYYNNMYFMMQNIIKYAREQRDKGNLGPIAEQVIKLTGLKGTLFKVVHFSLFGDRDKDIEEIEIQHNLRS